MSRRSVDEHVVEMRFNNSDFEEKAKQSMSTLDKLKEKLNLNGSVKGADELKDKISGLNGMTLDPLANSVKVLDVSFKAIAKNKLFETIADSAIAAGKKITSAIAAPINQIVEGGKKRAQNIEQAKFQLQGLGVTWDKIEDDINYGVKDTAYGLDEAAKAASQFVASGVQLGTEMQTALRGISGVAAMTNSSYSEIANIFTTISGNGKLMTMQLNQLASRGLNVAATLGKALGKTEAEIREMVTKGKIDFETFSKAMNEAFGDHAKEANKTFDGALSNTKAALSRTGANVATAGFEGLRRVLVSCIPVINSFNNVLKPIIGQDGIIYKGILAVADAASFWISRYEDIIKDDKTVEFFTKIGEVVEKYFIKAVEYVNVGFEQIEKSVKNFINGDGFSKVLNLIRTVSILIKEPLRAIKYGLQDAFMESNFSGIGSLIDGLNNFIRKLYMSASAQEGLRTITYNLAKAFIWLVKKTANLIKFLSPVIIGIKNIIDEILSLFNLNSSKNNKDPFEFLTKSKFIQTLKTEWPNIIDNIKKKFAAFFDYFKKIFTKIKESSAFISLVDKFKAGLQKIDDLFTRFIKLLSGSEKISSVFDFFSADNVADSVISVIEWLNNAIEAVSGFFGSLKGTSDEIDVVTASVDGLAGSFDNLGQSTGLKTITSDKFKVDTEKVKGIFSTIADKVKKFSEIIAGGLYTILESETLGRILGEMFGVITVLLSYNLVKLTKSLSEASENIGAFFKTLKARISGVKEIKLGSFLSVVGAIVALMAAIIGLAVACEKYQEGMVYAMAILLIVTGISVALYFLSTKLGTVDKSFSKATGAIASIIKSVALLMASVALLSTLLSVKGNFAGWVASLITLGIIFYAIAALFLLVNEVGKDGKKSLATVGGILAMCLLIGNIMAALAILQLFDSDRLIAAADAMMIVILALGVLAFLAKDIGGKGLMALVIVLASVMAIGFAVWAMSTIPWNEIIPNVLDPLKDSMTAMLVTFAAIFAVMLIFSSKGDGMLKAGASMVAIIGALALLAYTFVWFSNQFHNIHGAAIATLLGSMLVIIVYVAFLIEESDMIDVKKVDDLIIIIGGCVGLLLGIALAMKLLSTIPKEALGTAIFGTVLLLVGFAGLIHFLTKTLKQNLSTNDGKALKNLALLIFSVVAVVGVMAASLSVLSTVVDKEGLLYSALSMFTVLAGVAIVMVGISKLKGDYKDVLKMIVALVGVCAMMAIVANSLSTLAQYDWKNLIASAVTIMAMMALLTGITYAISEVLSEDIDGKKVGIFVTAMIGIAAAVAVMAWAADRMKDVNVESMANQMMIIASVLAALGMVAYVLSSAGKEILIGVGVLAAVVAVMALSGVAFKAMAWGLEALIPQLQALSNLDFEYIVANSAALFATSMFLAAAGAALTLGVLGYTLMGIALLVFAKGVNAVLPILAQLMALSWGTIIETFIKFVAVAKLVNVASYVLLASVPGIFAFGAALLVVGAALLIFVSIAEKVVYIISLLQGMGDAAKSAGTEVSSNLVDGVEEGLANANTEDLGKRVASSLLKGIFGEGGITSDVLKKGLTSALGKAYDESLTGVQFGGTSQMMGPINKISSGIRKGLESAINNKIGSLFHISDEDAKQVSSETEKALSGTVDGYSLFGFDSSSIDTNSVIEGFMSQIGGSVDVNKMFNMDNFDITQSLQNQINNCGGTVDLSPVMDMSGTNLTSLDNFAKVFQNGEANMKVTGNVDAIVEDQKDYTSDLVKMKTELTGVKTEVKNLNSNIKNMKLYLDGNTLVGGITSRMTSSINKNYRNYSSQSGQVKSKVSKTYSR